MSNMTNQSFYDKYKDAGISLELVSTVGIRAALSIIGISLNLSLLYVTICSKSLRSICNILIALETGAVTLFLPVNIFGIGLVASGVNFIPSSICCFIIQPISLLGLNFSIMTILFIAIDRFLSVFQPIWHAQRKKSTYIFAIMAICLLYAIFMMQMILRNVQPESPTICSSAADCMQNGVPNQYSSIVMAINGLSVSFYIGIWISIQIRAKNADSSIKDQISYTQRIFKALALWITFYMLGYVINSAIRLFISPALNLSPIQVFFMNSYLSAFSILSMFCNAPVLYAFSTEYRKGFNKIFGWKNEKPIKHNPCCSLLTNS